MVVGCLEFTADLGSIYMPEWIIRDRLQIRGRHPRNKIKVTPIARLPKAESVTFEWDEEFERLNDRLLQAK